MFLQKAMLLTALHKHVAFIVNYYKKTYACELIRCSDFSITLLLPSLSSPISALIFARHRIHHRRHNHYDILIIATIINVIIITTVIASIINITGNVITS